MDFIYGKTTTIELCNGQRTEDREEIEKAFVIGVVVSLDYCLDLMDSEFIKMLTVYYDLMKKDFSLLGNELPKNKDVKEDEHKDLLIRELDCAVIEYLHQQIHTEIEQDNTSSIKKFDSSIWVQTLGSQNFLKDLVNYGFIITK